MKCSLNHVSLTPIHPDGEDNQLKRNPHMNMIINLIPNIQLMAVPTYLLAE